MDDSKKVSEAFDILLAENVKLYTHGVLVQYGLTDEQALEIVANLTKLPKEKLVKLKNNRAEKFLQSMSGEYSPATLVNTFIK